jgi:transposase
MNNEASANSDRALARHAAISWVEQVLAEGYHLNRALALCSERPWGGRLYAAATIEEWYYAHRAGGFAALQRKARSDKGRRKALSPEARQALQQLRLEHPQLKVQALVRRLTEQGLLCPGPFSLPSVYRFLAEEGLDRRSLKRAPANVLPRPHQGF